ncbi:hypothetical protein KY284_033010 [Solanum tuberosum]|nr:hypothetical protein KY284_033010 [Solanum tuberosum]
MAFQNPLYASTFTSNPYPSLNALPFGGYGGDPYGYNNTGYGGYYSGYQQHFNHPYPWYSSNFTPHNPWQAVGVCKDILGVLDCKRGSARCGGNEFLLQQYHGLPLREEDGETHKSEYSHQSLPIQQHPPIRTTIADCHPFDYSIDEEIQMPQPELKEMLRYDNDLDLHVESMNSSSSSTTFDCCHQFPIDKESNGYYLRKRLIVNGLVENGDEKDENTLEDEHKVFEEMPTHEVVGYFDKLNDVCGDLVDTKNQWGDNICSIVEKVQEKVDEQWRKDVESEEEYDSTDFSFSFAMNSRTERYVADGLLVTYDGKTKVNDMLNCIGNEDFVTTASFSEEKGKIVAALAEEECAEFHLGLKFSLGLFIRSDAPTTGECPATFEKHFTTYRGCSFSKIWIGNSLGRSSIWQEMLLRGYPLQKKIEFPMSSNNFSFSLVNYCGDLLLSGVDTNSALAPAAATVIKRPEVIHVPGSAKVSAIRVLEKYLNRQGFLIVVCGCVTCSWKSMNLDESIVSTKSENDNVATVVLTGKRNLEEYVQFSRSANFPALLPLTFADALTNIVDQIEIRAHIFGDCLRFTFDPGDCFHLCACLLRCFLEVKEVLKEGVLIRFGNRALVGQIISWNFPLFMALSIYYNTILNILGIGKSRLYISNFERLGQGGRSIADNLRWLTRDTVSLLAIFSTQLTTYLLDNLSASRSHLYQPSDIIFSQGHNHNGCSLKEKKYSCLVDWRSKLRELIFNVVSFTWFILHVLGEPIHESSILSVVGKASGKQGRDMRKRLNVITLLVVKAADRKFIDIVLKNIAHLLIFSLEYDFVKSSTIHRPSFRSMVPGGWKSTVHCPFKVWNLQTLEMLEKKEKVLLKKAAAEVEKAKEFTRAKNKRAAIQCLKRKRLYEQQIEQLGNFQLRIHDQMIMLEGAKATTETVDALRTGAAAMKAMQKATNIDDVDKTMDEINEQTENMKLIQEALSTPIGSAADFDEDELEAELEELEGAELEEQLLQPATTAPNAPINLPAGRQQVRPAAQKTEEDELAALQAEMAL